MENRIDILNPIDRNKLKQNDYFRSIVNEAAEKHLLSEFDVEKIQTELIEILHSVCMTACEKGHSSMKTEDAEELAASVMYTLSVILKKSVSPENAVERLKNERLEALFIEGRQETVSLLTKARGKWTVICKELFETENDFYISTIKDGIKAFFQNYNYEIAAHKNIITCDYPLYEEDRALNGAEFIYKYLCDFKCENSFLTKFPSENVHSLMLCLDEDLKKAGFPFEKGVYKRLPLNIFIYVFACVLALEFSGKDIYSLCLTEKDIKEITDELKNKSYIEAVSFFDSLTEKVCRIISADEEMKKYLHKCVRDLASEVTLIKDKTLTGVFLCRKEKEGFFEADETERLSDSEYRFIISQLLTAEGEGRRLGILKESIKNAFDFADAVKDLSLTRKEIYSYLDGCDMAEKLRLFKRYNVFSFCLSDEDKELKGILEIYISSLEEKTKVLIMKMLSLMK